MKGCSPHLNSIGKTAGPHTRGGIDATSQPGNVELEEERPLETDECTSEDANLLFPSATLLGLECAEGGKGPLRYVAARRGALWYNVCHCVSRAATGMPPSTDGHPVPCGILMAEAHYSAV